MDLSISIHIAICILYHTIDHIIITKFCPLEQIMTILEEMLR